MLDWDDLRIFLAIRRHRTLAGAAKELRVTQSTVGRRLTAMQDGLGVRLLRRTGEGFQLTAAGEAILPKAERLAAAALDVELALAGHDDRLEGTVRVATSQMLANHLLAPGFASLFARDTAVMVEILAHGPLEALSHHQADISVQLSRFEHHDLVMRSLGTMQFGLYASVGYLQRFGMPDLEDGLAQHRIVAMVEAMDLPQHARWRASCGARALLVMRSDSYEMQYWAALSGSGLALLPRFRADTEPGLCLISTIVPPPPAEIWLAVHRDNRQLPRVRAVLDLIASTIRMRMADLDPPVRPIVPPAEGARNQPLL